MALTPYEKQKRYIERHPRKAKDSEVRYRYGITLEEYEAILSEGCAICGAEAICLDHCHKTKKARGGLCTKHNVGLGMFDDDIGELEKAIDYLRRY